MNRPAGAPQSSRTTMIVIFVVALLIGGYDVYVAIRGQGHNIVAWVLAAIMLLIAGSTLRKLMRGDYSGTLW